jgi:hypothetical protein
VRELEAALAGADPPDPAAYRSPAARIASLVFVVIHKSHEFVPSLSSAFLDVYEVFATGHEGAIGPSRMYLEA